MDHKTNQIVEKQRSCGVSVTSLPLKDNPEGIKQLSLELYHRFHAMKTYGKEPESLESIVYIFTRDLESFPTNKIMKAISIHAQRSQEFPTVFDIISLIKRNGAPPLSREIYISISKKDPEHRNHKDWQYMRDYEAQANEEAFGTDFPDPVKQEVAVIEKDNMRMEISKLREENEKLSNLLREARMAKGLERPKPTHEQQINSTIEYMKQTGADEEDIKAFVISQGLPETYLAN